MAFAGKNWDNADPTTKLPYTYDFTGRITSTDVINQVTWTLRVVPDGVYRGSDASPSTHLSNESISGQTVTAWLDSLVAGVRYRLVASIVTQDGVHDDLWAYVACDPTP